MRPATLAPLALLTVTTTALGQDDARELKLRDWQPRSMLVTGATEVRRPRFPAVDAHNHLGGGKAALTPEKVRTYLAEMDAAGVRTVVNLDGAWGDRLKETIAALDEAHPGRFLTYAQIDFEGIDEPGWTDRERGRLEEGFRAGAKGLKVHKSLGLGRRHKDGRPVAVDDPRIDALWDLCGRYGRPVVIHTGDPGAFFTPLDRHNERWHSLVEHPDWLFYGGPFPPRAELHAQRLRVIARHPRTTFICAHVANDAEDLAEVARWLDQYPNMHVGIDARIAELGRQPYSARRFLIRYQDRILFGTDGAPSRSAYGVYYRFLETDDESIDLYPGRFPQRSWRIYGVFLPPVVLEKLYEGNARRLLYGLGG